MPYKNNIKSRTSLRGPPLDAEPESQKTDRLKGRFSISVIRSAAEKMWLSLFLKVGHLITLSQDYNTRVVVPSE